MLLLNCDANCLGSGEFSKLSLMGRPGRIKGTREYAFADIPYVIANRLQSGVVEIITVIYGAQKWPLELD